MIMENSIIPANKNIRWSNSWSRWRAYVTTSAGVTLPLSLHKTIGEAQDAINDYMSITSGVGLNRTSRFISGKKKDVPTDKMSVPKMA